MGSSGEELRDRLRASHLPPQSHHHRVVQEAVLQIKGHD